MTGSKKHGANALFWLVASFILFLNAWEHAQLHMFAGILRYIYLAIFFYLSSFALAALYQAANVKEAQSTIAKPMFILIVSLVSGCTASLVINPITAVMAGGALSQITWETFSYGTLYFIFLYLIWGLLFFAPTSRFEKQIMNNPAAAETKYFIAEKNGAKVKIEAATIDLIQANKDYVSLYVGAESALLRATMANMESQLNQQDFIRVHRSIIINKNRIESTTRRAGGAYDIQLQSGMSVSSSRSYKVVIDQLIVQNEFQLA